MSLFQFHRIVVVEILLIVHCCHSSFSGVHFNSPQVQPTIEQVDQSFGATHPGGNTVLHSISRTWHKSCTKYGLSINLISPLRCT